MTSRTLTLLLPLVLSWAGGAVGTSGYFQSLLDWLGVKDEGSSGEDGDSDEGWDTPDFKYARGDADRGDKGDVFDRSAWDFEEPVEVWNKDMVWAAWTPVYLTLQAPRKEGEKRIPGSGVGFHVLDKLYPDVKDDARHTVRDKTGRVQVMNLRVRGNLSLRPPQER